MKKRKFKIQEVKSQTITCGGSIVTFYTKAGPFRYNFTIGRIFNSFQQLNPHLIVAKDVLPMLRNLDECVGKFLFVPERSK